MKILSIDWDYYFPDGMPYDMNHSENHSRELADILWSIRVGSRNLLTGKFLLDEYVPNVPHGFWGQVLGSTPKVYVADSHFKIWELLEAEMFVQVTSLDAHHDCGYKKIDMAKPYVDCSNWGVVGREFCRIGRLDLVYPAWRKNSEEDFVKGKLYHPTTISYELPALSDYDKVFICRSGAWTPPWFDDQFEEFVAGSCCEVTYLEAVEPRGVSLDQARVMRENMQKLMTNKMGVV